MHDPGPRSSNVQLGSACARVPVYYLASSVVVVVGAEMAAPAAARAATNKILAQRAATGATTRSDLDGMSKVQPCPLGPQQLLLLQHEHRNVAL
jgi:hypothetical protein